MKLFPKKKLISSINSVAPVNPAIHPKWVWRVGEVHLQQWTRTHVCSWSILCLSQVSHFSHAHISNRYNFWFQNKTSSIIHYHPSVPFWRQVTAQNPWSHKRASCVVGFKWKSLRFVSPGLSLFGLFGEAYKELGICRLVLFSWCFVHPFATGNWNLLQIPVDIRGLHSQTKPFFLRGTRRDFSIKSLRAALLSCLSLSQYQTQKMKPHVTSSSWNDIVVEWYHRHYVNHMFLKQHHYQIVRCLTV